MIGTMGCAPAYDQYLKNGLKKKHLIQTFGSKSMGEIFRFYEENKDEFEKIEFKTKNKGLPLSPRIFSKTFPTDTSTTIEDLFVPLKEYLFLSTTNV